MQVGSFIQSLMSSPGIRNTALLQLYRPNSDFIKYTLLQISPAAGDSRIQLKYLLFGTCHNSYKLN